MFPLTLTVLNRDSSTPPQLQSRLRTVRKKGGHPNLSVQYAQANILARALLGSCCMQFMLSGIRTWHGSRVQHQDADVIVEVVRAQIRLDESHLQAGA